MKSCFKSEMIITQPFNNDFKYKGEWYYRSMGILGHDGIDVTPKDQKDKRIFSIMPGIIMIIKLHKIYGFRIAIWNPELKLTEYHNHLRYFSSELKLHKEIMPGTFLGGMGETGKTFGPHNHFALARTDEKANRINRHNGYYGYIDPMPFLKNNIT